MTAELENDENAVAARPNVIPPLKDFITFVPILATALAVFYDVGYFYGFRHKLFQLFHSSTSISYSRCKSCRTPCSCARYLYHRYFGCLTLNHMKIGYSIQDKLSCATRNSLFSVV